MTVRAAANGEEEGKRRYDVAVNDMESESGEPDPLTSI